MDVEDLLSLIPPAPAALLWIGTDDDQTPEQLRAAGYLVVQLPLSLADREALERGATPKPLRSFPPAPGEAGCFAACIIRGHRLGTPPLALMNGAFERLGPEAPLFIEIAAETLPQDVETRARNLGYLAALAGRCGFVTEPPNCGLRKTCLLICRRAARAPRWRIDLLDARDIDGFSALFKEAFNAEISTPLWNWKYADGRGQGIIARRGEKIIAHYGCVRRRALYFGQPITALQMCDVMVDPRERGVMTKQGAMFLTTAIMLELYLALQPADLPFGFPSGRHARLGERLGLYAEVDQIREVRWSALTGRPRLRTRLQVLDPEDPKSRAIVEKLWSGMSHEIGGMIAVVRDWDYLTYRYLEHPHHHYELILVKSRLTGTPLGLMVLRRIGDTLELLDILGPLGHIPTLVDQARRLAGRWGAASLFCWITRHHLERFTTADATVSDPDVSIPTNVWVHGPAVEDLRDQWWLMSGDTEFH